MKHCINTARTMIVSQGKTATPLHGLAKTKAITVLWKKHIHLGSYNMIGTSILVYVNLGL